MIQVRVREDDGFDAHRQGLPVAFAQFPQSLEHPAVHEDLVTADVKQMLGACDRSRGTIAGQSE